MVMAALDERGWDVREAQIDRRVILLASRADTRRRLRVSAKRSGSWQTSLRYGSTELDPELVGRLWVFVDVREGEFFVVPEDWMRTDIARAHAKFLQAHGGVRPTTPTSTHHAIHRDRIAQWKDRWDLLG